MAELAHRTLHCFVVAVQRNGRWRKFCFDHAPEVPYRFFTQDDADQWARRNLTDGFLYEIWPETAIFHPEWGVWM